MFWILSFLSTSTSSHNNILKIYIFLGLYLQIPLTVKIKSIRSSIYQLVGRWVCLPASMWEKVDSKHLQPVARVSARMISPKATRFDRVLSPNRARLLARRVCQKCLPAGKKGRWEMPPTSLSLPCGEERLPANCCPGVPSLVPPGSLRDTALKLMLLTMAPTGCRRKSKRKTDDEL